VRRALLLTALATGAALLPRPAAAGSAQVVSVSTARATARCPHPGTATVYTVPDTGAPGGRRRVWVYRPAGRDSATTPVVYLLHGDPGSAGDLGSPQLAALLDARACAGLTPVVAAAPDGNGPHAEDTEWADDARGRFRVESFVTGRLRQVVEGRAVRSSTRRALVGFSMGGYGAVAIAERHPDTYRSAVAIAGYFHIDDPDSAFGTGPQDHGHDAAHDPDALAAHARGLHLLLVDGNDDREPVAAGETQRYAQLLRARHIPVTARIDRGGHTLDYARSELPGALAFLDHAWPG